MLTRGSKMIKDVLKKIAALDSVKSTLSKEEIAEIDSFEDSRPDSNSDWERKVKAESAKAARILDEKKQVQEKFNELSKQLDEIKSADLSDTEKLQEQISKAVEQNQQLEKELDETKSQYQKQVRNYKIEKISKKIRFLDTVPEDMQKMSIEAAFSGVEDLDDEHAVNDAIKKFVDSHKGVIESDSPKGSDSQGRHLNITSSKKEPSDMSMEERATALKTRLAERRKI